MKAGILPVVILLLAGSGDLAALLEKIGGEKDTARRAELVRQLSTSNTARAAAALKKIARRDASPRVRVAAARALGDSKAEDANRLLLELLLSGGIRRVREAVGRGIAGRPGGIEMISKPLQAPRGDALTKGLCVEALAVAPGPVALHRLLKLAAGDDVQLRCEALRAIARRRDGEDQLVSLLDALLKKHRDVRTVMTVIDLVERRPIAKLRPAVERFRTILDPVIARAVGHALAVMEYEKKAKAAKAAAAAAKRDGYEFSPPDRPIRPPPRPRFDLVYGFDSTGSVSTHLPAIRRKIRSQHRFLVETGSDVRVGVVVFRDRRDSLRYPALQVLPLTHDLVAVEVFLDAIRTGGADSQGAAVSLGLAEGLDRMGWRRDARGSFTLIADSRLDDPARCTSLAKIHLAADGIGLKVVYVLRTRSKVPADVRALSEVSGFTLEVME